MAEKRTCSEVGCGRPAKTRGLCGMHYQRWRATIPQGEPLPPWTRLKPGKNVCSIDGCDRECYGRGWCHFHYQHWKRKGDPLWERPNALQRWMSHVNMDGPTPTHDPSLGPCWLWTAHINKYGYGVFGLAGESPKGAHQWGYERLVGPVPEGLVLDHICHHPDHCRGGDGCPHRSCANPSHLEPVTTRENLMRGAGLAAANAAKTHCPNGHEYTEQNTYIYGRRRACRTCHRVKEAVRRERRRQGLMSWS